MNSINYYYIIIIILIIIILAILYKVIKKIFIKNYNVNNIDNSKDIKDINCLYERYGCCNDKITPRLDQDGTNCVENLIKK